MAGFDLRFVGGCVRDNLLRLVPNDYDLATPMPVEQGLSLLRQQSYTTIPTGVDHGTLTLVINKIPYQITTLRRDVATDGRRATIAYTDKWEEDAARRDFTINALYMDTSGKIYDYTDGQADLKAGIVQFIGNPEDRIKEDYLRILRFFRFHERFSKFPISDDIQATLKIFAPLLNTLSRERITQEFMSLLAGNAPHDGLIIMDHCSILQQFLKDYDIGSFETLIRAEKTAGTPISALRRLAALRCKDHTLALSNTEKKYLKTITLIEKNLDKLSLPYLMYKYGIPHVQDVFLIKGDLEKWQNLNGKIIPPFPLTADDLIEVGIVEGVHIGTALTAAEHLWCESEFNLTKADLLATLEK